MADGRTVIHIFDKSIHSGSCREDSVSVHPHFTAFLLIKLPDNGYDW